MVGLKRSRVSFPQPTSLFVHLGSRLHTLSLSDPAVKTQWVTIEFGGIFEFSLAHFTTAFSWRDNPGAYEGSFELTRGSSGCHPKKQLR